MVPAEEQDTLTGRVIVDGIEGNLARVELEDGQTEDWPLASLPGNVREGDVLRLHLEGGDLTVEIDHGATRERREAAQAQLDALNGVAPVGEIDL
ncbi:DUF3006 domain-containing protein [Deinococcus aetherius]|nr:DUF3006 domain-containing protein [Deinococcus aetherius]